MSQENVEIARRFIEDTNQTRDFPWELVDPDVVYVIEPPAWLAGTYRGHAELKDMLRRTWEVYDEFRFEVDQFVEAGDAVVALGVAHVRGALSGAMALQTGGVVYRVRGELIVAVRVYLEHDQALEAVGLRE
jgi:ketosteroid isomerase-like protein